MTIYIELDGVPQVNYFSAGEEVNLAIGGDPIDSTILRVEYFVRGTDESLDSTAINTINAALSLNLNTTNWTTYFTNPSSALLPGGRGILLQANIYLLDGQIRTATGIAYTKGSAGQSSMPLIAGQGSETSSLYGWVPQINAQTRYGGDSVLGAPIPINSSATASHHTAAVSGNCSLWFDQSAGKLKLAVNGTTALYEVNLTASSW